MTPNELLDSINWNTWNWWLPLFVAGLYNLIIMYKLDAPVSLGGRMARTLAFMGNVLCLGLPWVEHVRYFAGLLLIYSFCVLNTQYLYECRAKRRRRPPPPPGETKTALKKFADAVVSDNHKEPDPPLRPEDHLFLGDDYFNQR